MDGFLKLVLAAAVVLVGVRNQVDCSFFNMRRVSRAKVSGFSWKNCGEPDDPAVMKSMSVAPDPICIPGTITASASGSTSVPLESKLSLNVTLKKEVAGIWVEIPCLEEVGSCHYHDACDVLDQLIPTGQDCPEPLHTCGLPCHCPFKPGLYSLPTSDFDIPYLDLPYWLTMGNYWVQGVLGHEGKELGCLQISLSIQSS